MPTSDNGWPVISDRSKLTTVTVPGVNLSITVANPVVAFLFSAFIQRFDAMVEPVHGPILDDWSYNYKLIPGSNNWSCHSSATAVDINALQHVWKVHNTFSPAKVAAIRKVLAEFQDPNTGLSIFKWGGDFHGTIDQMHWQIQGDASAVSRVVTKLKSIKPAQEDTLPSIKDIWTSAEADVIPHNQTGDPTKPTNPANLTWRPASVLEEIDRLVRLLVEKDAAREAQLTTILAALGTKK